MLRFRFLLFFIAFSLCACERMQSQQVNGNKKLGIEVVYGKDNRLDLFEVEDVYWRQLALSTLILVDHERLTFNPAKQTYTVTGVHYGKKYNLCKDEKFYDQPTAGFCSGFLIGPDIVVTAGHCIRNQYNCEDVRLVFDFFQTDVATQPTEVDEPSVHECLEIIHTQANGITGSDFAILRLKKPVLDRKPLLVRTRDAVDSNASLTVIGYPSGLPGKVAPEGRIFDNDNAAYFVANLDTFYGNSGSAVFDSDSRLVEGLLFRGEKDFAYDPQAQCRRSKVCTADTCSGEGVVRISEVLNHLTPSDLN